MCDIFHWPFSQSALSGPLVSPQDTLFIIYNNILHADYAQGVLPMD